MIARAEAERNLSAAISVLVSCRNYTIRFVCHLLPLRSSRDEEPGVSLTLAPSWILKGLLPETAAFALSRTFLVRNPRPRRRRDLFRHPRGVCGRRVRAAFPSTATKSAR